MIKLKNRKPRDVLIVREDNFSLKQFPTMDLKKQDMHKVLYALVVGSFMYAQVYTHPNLAFILVVLSVYLRNRGK